MAHEISTESGRPEMMYVGRAPWHGLGQYVGDKDVTAEEAIKAAALDWNVEKRRSMFKRLDGSTVPGIGWTTVRTDTETPLGHVGDVYTPLQNREAFRFMDNVCGKANGGAYYHTAGALGRGERVWVLVRFNGTEEVSPGDPVESFLLLSNGHDGSHAVDIRLTTVRVVCANTLAVALNRRETGGFFKFRHTGDVQNKVDGVRDAFAAVSDKFRKFIEAGRLLRGEEIKRTELEDFLARLELCRANERENAVSAEALRDFKRTEKFRQLVGAFEYAPGARAAGSTLWGAVNAVTYYYDHVAKPKDTGRYDTLGERRLASSWFGSGAEKKEAALALALDFAKRR